MDQHKAGLLTNGTQRRCGEHTDNRWHGQTCRGLCGVSVEKLTIYTQSRLMTSSHEHVISPLSRNKNNKIYKKKEHEQKRKN